MKYEPLKNKKQKMIKNSQQSKNNDEFYRGFEKGVDNSFELFYSFIDLYKKYKNDIKLLMNEQKNIWSKWVDYYEKQNKIDATNYIDNYNNWLFDYIFSDFNEDSSELLNL